MTAEPGSPILLTGATGFVGMELLARYLERTDRDVVALVRAANGAEAHERLRGTLVRLGLTPERYEARLTAVPADVERDGLGIAPERRAELAERVREVIHLAASVSFTLPLEDSRHINVDGTRHMLEFAQQASERGGLDRFAYVSTAYVAGTHPHEFREDQLEVGQDFRNPYERSKFEAEMLVRSHADRLPIQIFRPSIIVGERRTGWTASFNVLYAPLKAFGRGALPFLPADRSAPVDVVPVDYVADAIFTLAGEPVVEAGETFHLVSGGGATTVGRLTERAAAHLGRRPPWILPPKLYRRLLHPLLAHVGSPARRRALIHSEVFFPYFTMQVRFDDERARGRLAPFGVRVVPVEGYLDRLIEFARAADWGQRSLRRPHDGVEASAVARRVEADREHDIDGQEQGAAYTSRSPAR
jgi:long-chain acyl-CoA synthetase